MPAGVGADPDRIAPAGLAVAWVVVLHVEEGLGVSPCTHEPSSPASASLGKVLVLGESYTLYPLVGQET